MSSSYSSDTEKEPTRPRVADRKGCSNRRRKKQIFRGNIHTRIHTDRSNHGYVIIDRRAFDSLARKVVCIKCSEKIKFELCDFQGLFLNIKVLCSKCGSTGDIKSSTTLRDSRQKEVNIRATLAMRMLGQGLAGLQTFCGFMGLQPPVSRKTYESYNRLIMISSEKVAAESMRAAVEREVELTNRGRDIAVSGDGSWRKPGFSSLQGVSTLIGAKSKRIIDTCTKNTICKVCDSEIRTLTTDEFEVWKAEHGEACKENHYENSGKMETDGICEMFQRSIALYNVRYLQYIGDGDAKVYKRLVESKPYSSANIMKKECVAHIQKRMGTRLRNLRKEKGALVSGQGRLTLNYINVLTAYYGKAIRHNSDDIGRMLHAIRAVFFYESSTDACPQHRFCPKGSNSWCKFNRAVATNTAYSHKKTLPAEVWALIKPIFEDLSTDELLSRCLGGYTQNANESFNAKVWKLAPKKLFSGHETVRIAVALATISFNEGMEGLFRVFDDLSLDHGPEFITCLRNFDQLRARNKSQRSTSSRGPSRSILSQLEDNSDMDDECQYGAGIDD